MVNVEVMVMATAVLDTAPVGETWPTGLIDMPDRPYRTSSHSIYPLSRPFGPSLHPSLSIIGRTAVAIAVSKRRSPWTSRRAAELVETWQKLVCSLLHTQM